MFTVMNCVLVSREVAEMNMVNNKGQEIEKYSSSGTRTRVSWVKAMYPNHLD